MPYLQRAVLKIDLVLSMDVMKTDYRKYTYSSHRRSGLTILLQAFATASSTLLFAGSALAWNPYNPENAPTPTPTPSPTPTATPTSTPVPPQVQPPTPYDPPPTTACLWSYVEVRRSTGGKNENIYQNPLVSPCVTQFLHNVVAQCRGDEDGGDDCSAEYILGNHFDDDYDDDTQIIAYSNVDCVTRRIASTFEFNAFRSCAAGYFATASPISLIFGPGDEVDGKLVFSKFPLNPKRTDGWYTWRASERAPLLVYDPSHSGSITSSAQLFGEWTFGGRQLASLWTNTSAQSNSASGKWQNGYEALGTLDKNRDGRISGDELTPLALWFDKNRDGISQPGEVRTLETAGVTALFYKPSRVNSSTGSIYADQGFERTVDGKTTSGISVDWFAKEADSEKEVLMAEIIARIASVKTPRGSNAESSAVPKDSKLTGVWHWKEKNAQTKGALMLFEKENGTVSGYSVIDAPFNSTYAKEFGHANSMIVMKLRGTTSKDSSGKLAVNFQVKMSDGGVTESLALLSNDGLTLTGKSVLKATADGRVIASTDYEWEAAQRN